MINLRENAAFENVKRHTVEDLQAPVGGAVIDGEDPEARDRPPKNAPNDRGEARLNIIHR